MSLISATFAAPLAAPPIAARPDVLAARLLIVDDEPLNRELLEGLAELLGHETMTARDGREALDLVAAEGETLDLVLLDVMMPVLDGFGMLDELRAGAAGTAGQDLPVILVTALDDRSSRLRAVEAGANDYIGKPVDKTEFRVRTASLLKLKRAQDALKSHQAHLETLITDRTASLRRAMNEAAQAHERTQAAHVETIRRLALAAEYRDGDTAAHIERVGAYCALLARALGLPARDVALIQQASPMHDVGKIGLPDAILLKPGVLSPDERAQMQQHTVMGARVLGGSRSPLLAAGETIALSHHERWDGTGYPHGLQGEQIPLMGRICAIADVFDALTSARPYKSAFPAEHAREILVAGRGSHFDPALLDCFLSCFPDVLAIQERFREP